MPYIEKLYLINNSNYIGNAELINKFEKLTNNYISENLVTKNKLIKPLSL